MPRISIILPAYNAASFLNKSIESVLNQSYNDFELIIVNDGSTDDTADIIKKYENLDNRIRSIHQKNSGVSVARNIAIKKAKGEFIGFLDADDYLEKDACEKMINAIDSTGANCAMCSHYRLWPNGTKEVDAIPFSSGLHNYEEIMEKLVKPLLQDRVSANLVFGSACRFLFDRKRIEDMNIKFSGAYLEDEIFLIEYFSKDTNIVCVEDALYNYLQNPNSVTHRYIDGYIDIFLRSLDIKKDLVKRNSIPVEKYWMYNTCWAGLLIAVGNEFAPGNPRTMKEKRKALSSLCLLPEFKSAIENYNPMGMNRNKAIVVYLIRKKAYFLLSCLYAVKNINRNK